MILAAAAAVRIYHLSGKSLWLDEYFSVECSSGWGRTDLHVSGTGTPAPRVMALKYARPWWTIWRTMAADENHPPAYFILLRFWRDAFGDSAAALRSFSVLASLVSVVLMFLVGRTAYGTRTGLMAAAIMAVAWPQVQHAQEARPYALLTTASLAAALALVRVEKLGITRGRCIALVLSALAMPLVHYMGLATLGAMLLYAALGQRGQVRKVTLVCLLIATLAYAGIWGPNLLHQHRALVERTAWLSDDPTSHLSQTVQRLLLVPVRMFVEPGVQNARSWTLTSVGVVGLLLPLLLVRRVPGLLLWWLWLAVPVFTALVIDLTVGRASLDNPKYTLAAAPAAYLMVAMLADSTRRGAWAVPAVMVLACAASLPGVYASTLTEPDWREAAQFIAANTDPTDPVLLVDHRPYWPGGYFLVGVRYNLNLIGGQRRPLSVLDNPPSPQLLQQLGRRARHVTVVGSGDDITQLRLPAGASMGPETFIPNLAVLGVVDFPPSSASQPAR